MYGTNAIAYKLPTIRDRRSAFMMWTAWLAMLIISAITSAFIALLLVNGADSKIDTARMSMEQASKVAGVETASVATATRQLEQWITNGSDARTMRTRAIERRDAAQAILFEWRQDTLDEWGQGSKAANRRMAPTHPEHAPLIAAVNRAQKDVDSAQDDIRLSDARVEEWTTKLAESERTQRVALNRSSDTTVTESSPWEETMSDMASMMAIFGLNFVDGSQFKATFAIFFALGSLPCLCPHRPLTAYPPPPHRKRLRWGAWSIWPWELPIPTPNCPAVSRRYGGGDKVAKMLKHFLFVEGYGEYTADGSITLYNPAEAAA